MPENNNNKNNVKFDKSTLDSAVDFLFSNPGKKINILAYICFALAALGSIIMFINFIEYEAELGFAILIGGILGQYVISLFLVGFGDLVEKTSANARSVSLISGEENNIDELPEL